MLKVRIGDAVGRGIKLPILRGPLRGKWWLLSSRGKLARVLAGTYELEQTRYFRRWVLPGDIVIDAGAHAGYYTLLASVLAGETGAVWSFEPNPSNTAFLHRHVAVNKLRNVHVEATALSDVTGRSRFQLGSGSATGHLGEAGNLEVDTTTLDEFCATHSLTPSVIKLDVEGAERRVLEGGMATLARAEPLLFLSTHGQSVHLECLELLTSLGYDLQSIGPLPIEQTSELLAIPRRLA